MNIPTFVWNPKNPITYVGYTYKTISSSPYLTDCLGKDWKTLQELENLIKSVPHLLTTFSPREWVLHNMSDEIFASTILNTINKGINNA